MYKSRRIQRSEVLFSTARYHLILNQYYLFNQRLRHDFSGNDEGKFERIPDVCPYARSRHVHVIIITYRYQYVIARIQTELLAAISGISSRRFSRVPHTRTSVCNKTYTARENGEYGNRKVSIEFLSSALYHVINVISLKLFLFESDYYQYN